MILDHVEGIATTVRVRVIQAESVISVYLTQAALLTATRVLTPSSTFLQLGAANDGIIVEGGDLPKPSPRATEWRNGKA
jgi:hypothetical protein